MSAGSKSFAGETPLARGFAARAAAVAGADRARWFIEDEEPEVSVAEAVHALAWAAIGIEAQLARIADALDRDGRDALS